MQKYDTATVLPSPNRAQDSHYTNFQQPDKKISRKQNYQLRPPKPQKNIITVSPGK